MMSAIYSWMKNIIVFMIITTVILNLLGKKNYRKYVGLVTGLILVLLVIGPILSLTGKVQYFDFSLDSYESLVEAEDLSQELFAMEALSSEDILMQYKKVIITQTSHLIGDKGLMVVSMDVIVNDDKSSKDFGQLIFLDLIASYKTDAKMPEESNGIRPIDKIEIDKITFDLPEEEVKESQKIGLSPMEIYIKNQLADFYNIDHNNINISIQEEHNG